MKETHIILRKAPAATRRGTRGGPMGVTAGKSSTKAGSASMSVEVENIDRRDIPSLTRKKEILAVALVDSNEANCSGQF